MTADGKPYYQNVITRTTSWDPPVGWKESSPSVETTSLGAHALFEDKGDGHEVARKSAEIAKEAVETSSNGRGVKTDEGFTKGPGVCLVGVYMLMEFVLCTFYGRFD